ncbi:MAG: carbohydrate ABC transporter permease [Alkalispirochaeta sp.]
MAGTTLSSFIDKATETTAGRLIFGIGGPIVVAVVFFGSFLFMRDSEAHRLTIASVALVVGVGGVWLLFGALNSLVEVFPIKIRDAVRPLAFVLPGALILLGYIILPAMRTIWISFFNRTSEEFVGLRNYVTIFSNEEMLVTLRNTLGWVIIVPFVSVALGLVIAVMADRLSQRWEKANKTLIFLPMAISFVGASVIWRFIYAYQPAGDPQIGLLNAVVVALGGDPRAWWTVEPWNNFFLMVIMVWLQTGFAMVILSAAVKGVPRDLLDSARVDGAGEIRSFFYVTVPYIAGTILTVLTTILFLVLKIFDIVWVMTSGDYGTHIVASRFYEETFVFRNFGRGSTLAVILLIIVVPFMVRNIRQMNENRS